MPTRMQEKVEMWTRIRDETKRAVMRVIEIEREANYKRNGKLNQMSRICCMCQ